MSNLKSLKNKLTLAIASLLDSFCARCDRSISHTSEEYIDYLQFGYCLKWIDSQTMPLCEAVPSHQEG